MADASYDAVIIGGGPNGLTVACYLANAGLDVVVLERQHELGGGACGDEIPLPGFLSNPCGHWVYFYRNPAWHDLKLYDKGLKYAFHDDLGYGIIFDDGTCLQGYSVTKVIDPLTGESKYWPENAQRGLREIARFSERDAETACILREKWQRKWGAAYEEWLWNPPPPPSEKDAMERLFDDRQEGIDPIYQVMTVKEIAYDLFESKELQIYLMRAVLTVAAGFPGDVMHIGDIVDRLRVVASFTGPASSTIGGTHAVTHALQKALTEMGGKFFIHHDVDRILIEDGAASGVQLVDGTTVKAKKLVVSDAGPNITLLKLLGERYIDPQLARRVRNFSYDRGGLFWVNFAIHELPQYKAADFNPDCLRGSRLFYSPKDPETLVQRHEMEIFTRGIPEKLYFAVGADSILDKTRAPEGKHNVLLENFAAPARYFSTKEWLRMKKEIANEMVRQWQWYAPNMTWDNVIAAYANTPYDVVQRNVNMHEGSWVLGAHTASQMGKFRPCPELARYRTPVRNLYLCGGSQHYGGGVHGRNGYNCYKIIARDFGLPKIWEEKGRPY